jgi:acylphosphatase
MPVYRILFSGHVQGVGFRATCQHLAQRLPALAGQVCNLNDGCVELTVRGPAENVNQLVELLRHTFPGYIDDVQQTELPAGSDPLPANLLGVRIVRGH